MDDGNWRRRYTYVRLRAPIAGVIGAIISPLIISTYGILNAPTYLVSAVTPIRIVTVTLF